MTTAMFTRAPAAFTRDARCVYARCLQCLRMMVGVFTNDAYSVSHVAHFGATVAGIAASMQQRRSNHHESTDRTNDLIDRTTRSIERFEPSNRIDRTNDSIDRAIRSIERFEPTNRIDRSSDSIDRTDSSRSNERIDRSSESIVRTIRWIGPHRSVGQGCLDAR